MAVGFTSNYPISVYHQNKVASSNPTHGEVYSIQHYVISLLVTCDRSVVFSGYSSTNKTDCHNITEILLKVVKQSHVLEGHFFLS
jgi:hypothetical protein